MIIHQICTSHTAYVIDTLLTEYPTTLEEDEHILSSFRERRGGLAGHTEVCNIGVLLIGRGRK